MRRLALLFLVAAMSAPAQEVGANFNHDPELIDIALLKRTPVEWVRTTPDIFDYIQGRQQPESSPGLANVIAAARAGYHIAFGFLRPAIICSDGIVPGVGKSATSLPSATLG